MREIYLGRLSYADGLMEQHRPLKSVLENVSRLMYYQ